MPFIVPWLGQRVAELLEMPFMYVIITKSAEYIVRHFALQDRALIRLLAGFTAVELLVGVEELVSVVVFGHRPSDFFTDRDPVSGWIYFGMLGLFAFMPYILSFTKKLWE